MLRSALVAIDGSPCSDSATTVALDWAVRFHARLLGVGVVDEQSVHPREPVPPGATAYKKARDQARLADAHHRVAGFLAGFRARAVAARVPVEIVEEVGDPGERILWDAQRCDVVIIGRETHFRFTTEGPDATLAQVLRSSPRPLVVVPAAPTDGRGVLVAYGGGREAAHTLQGFEMLGLAGREHVDVVIVHRDLSKARAFGRAAGAFLAAHGVAHRIHAVASAAPPAAVLLEKVRSRRPRLLVMGAHGRHPLRDLFARSVTHDVLDRCPVPVFVGV